MIRFTLTVCLIATLAGGAHGESAGTVRVRLRAVVHDPMNPAPELWADGQGNARQRLNLALEGIGAPQDVEIVDGALRLFLTDKVDPAKPGQGLAASARLATDMERVIAVIVPSTVKDAPPYRMMLMNESENAFPMGESRVVNFTTSEIGITAGEHRKKLKSGGLGSIPPVIRLNHMNQAQVQFYQKSGDDWQLVSERPTQFTDSARHLFLVFTMPNVPEAQIRTLIDIRNDPG